MQMVEPFKPVNFALRLLLVVLLRNYTISNMGIGASNTWKLKKEKRGSSSGHQAADNRCKLLASHERHVNLVSSTSVAKQPTTNLQ